MPESRVALFLGVDISITVLALSVVVLRVWHRWSQSRLAISDYLVSTAMLAAVIHLILDITITAAFGYGRHQRDLPPDLQGSYKTNLMFWLIQIFTKLPLLFSKLSLTFVYRDLMTLVDHPLVKFSRAVNYTLMVVLAGFFTAATLVSMFACDPVYKSWLPKVPGHCIDTTVMFNYVTGSVNVSTSICLICIPLPVLYLAKNKRIEVKQLTALILFGLIDTIISIVRLYMITDLYNVKTDFTWLIIPTHIMIVVEMNITIIAASLVVMRPCFQAIFDLAFPTSLYASHNASSRGDSNYHSRRSDGYIMSLDENDGAVQHDESTENRLRNPTDRPEWHNK
ncbi:PTH11-type GPCRs protein [Trichoderma simmonsii]|uniref:PTH11-type GPCRs protein n=1 Tax=Trichoderma simmonsii TaxID=1491479 RepID=A0A8G0LMA4_9HYPO|nr:PTH11-type GPCRs protein [Trichoderma simmonsii]